MLGKLFAGFLIHERESPRYIECPAGFAAAARASPPACHLPRARIAMQRRSTVWAVGLMLHKL